ncbi:MAG: hypothetical protein JEZ00_07890 [Anaerolineaceae bacterium]|nr:hypothetical protein [Anaerolineaceae bacterium]
MKFLLLEREADNLTAQHFQPYLEEEAQHVWKLVQQGVLRETYFDAEQHNAVLMMECESKGQAEQFTADFPLVQAGLIRFEIIPLKPYDGFARLFDKKYRE